ncbi:MAG TPA: lysophospholipid acyltransferase family protein [Usitatibacteraceae bacterium]|nr:lysophospholipid acyltransferase family protein [Usitatibacteraceae bacterium]
MSATDQARYPALQSNRLTRAVRWLRLLAHFITALLMVGLVFPRVSEARRASLTGWWAQALLRILNVVLTARGARPEATARNLIIASNHISWLDIFAISAAHPARFVAKAEIRDWPVAGWLCDRAGTIFIRRARRRDTAKINETMHAVLSTGATIGFFPEGTTTNGERLLKFNTSLFESAVVNKATLVPVALRYRADDGELSPAIAHAGDAHFLETVAMIIRERRIVADVTFAPPIAAEGATRRDLAERAEAAVAAVLNVPRPAPHQRLVVGVNGELAWAQNSGD